MTENRQSAASVHPHAFSAANLTPSLPPSPPPSPTERGEICAASPIHRLEGRFVRLRRSIRLEGSVVTEMVVNPFRKTQ